VSDRDLMGIPLDELLAEIEEQIEAPDPGEEYLSTEQWARVWGVPQWRATQAIGKLVRAGTMEASERVETDRRGRPYRKPVYRLIGT